MHRVDEDGRLTDFIDTIYESRRQDLPVIYRRNGAIWVARTEVLLKRNTFFTDRTYAYMMSQDRSLEIDTEEDLLFADLLMSRKG